MQYVIGALIAASFFVVLLAAYNLGKRSKVQVTPTQKKEDEEAREKARKMREEFKEIMSYNVDKAMGRKG